MHDRREPEPDRPDSPDPGRLLNNWKEIADYLGVSVRTAHRWEAEAQMPIHRAATGHAYAIAEELDRWRRGRVEKPGRPWTTWALPIAGVLVLMACGVVIWRIASIGPPASVAFTGETMVVLDARGRLRWSTTVPGLREVPGLGWEVSASERVLVADIDGDGQTEVALGFHADASIGLPGKLICYGQDGRVRWEHTLGRVIRDVYGEYPQNYILHMLRVVQVDGQPLLLAVAQQLRWHPCVVALIDPRTGRTVEEFWHPGVLTHAVVADMNGDGTDELLLAGLNNPGPGLGVPVAMALRLPFSRTPAVATSQLAAYSSGGPYAYVVMPRPDVLSAEGGVAVVADLLFEPPRTIVVHSRYARKANSPLTYRFDQGLHLEALFMPREFEAIHGTLAKSGALDHVFDARERAQLERVQPFAFVPDGNALPAR